MSTELNTAEFYDELYGVDGDGLGEGEVACEAEIEYSYWLFHPYSIASGVIETARKCGA